MFNDILNGNKGLLENLGAGSQTFAGGIDGTLLTLPGWLFGAAVIIAGIAALASGATAGTASAVANNPFIQHDMGTASADGGNLLQEQLANAADAINNLHIPGVYIPVQRP